MTTIEWVKDRAGNQGKSWNPIVGCSKVSPGCTNCYAEVMARRLKGMGRPEYQNVINGNGRWTGEVTLVPGRLKEPLKRKKPTTYFVNSMSDLFHEKVPFDFILKTFSVMWQARQHTFQVLTKRPGRMLEFAEWMHGDESLMLLSDNVWLGVTIESAAYLDRIDYLLQTPAAVRFVSFEPLLDDVAAGFEQGRGHERIDWAIVGGESGPKMKARPMHPDWARALREWALCWGIPFFFKQFGTWKEIQFDKRDKGDILFSPTNGIVERLPDPFNGNAEEFKHTIAMRPVGKKRAGRILDGREWNQMPEVAE
jgi:protein gp37